LLGQAPKQASTFFPGQDSVVAGHLSLQIPIQELEKSGSSVQASIQDTKSPKGHGLVVGGLVVVEVFLVFKLENSAFFGFSVA
jgi:hypothetical protein